MEESTVKIIQNAAYLLASILFIRGLKGLTHPRTAVRGNLMGAVAMLIAIVATLWGGGIMSWTWIFAGLIVGTAAGAYLAITVEMTGMPQMVGLFNGFGGAASFLVAGGELIMSINRSHAAQDATAAATQTAGHGGLQFMIAVALSGVIGSVTLFGSVVAAGKLKELTFTFRGKKYWMSNALFLPGRHFVNGALFALTIFLCVLIVKNPDTVIWYAILVVVAG
ncbi:MAG: NAD(P)(+) transhydrogenase (Re/Si-specific) subunit beta, partial [Planctomycetes bacterium]|nr:NAD(P)(+) transhydrogenase (Re/Si-specific) subunit beta [Planctomycetota bacterium]